MLRVLFVAREGVTAGPGMYFLTANGGVEGESEGSLGIEVLGFEFLAVTLFPEVPIDIEFFRLTSAGRNVFMAKITMKRAASIKETFLNAALPLSDLFLGVFTIHEGNLPLKRSDELSFFLSAALTFFLLPPVLFFFEAFFLPFVFFFVLLFPAGSFLPLVFFDDEELIRALPARVLPVDLFLPAVRPVVFLPFLLFELLFGISDFSSYL
jgi:hypothetical protein